MNGKFALVITALVLIIAAAAWLSGNNLQTKQCGNVILEGYLLSCPWQAVPSLPDHNCYLDVWFSESTPTEASSEACGKPPITSACFIVGAWWASNPIDEIEDWPLMPPEYPANKIKLVGNYEKMNVCTLSAKCLEPECRDCAETDVFVPCEMKKV